MTAEEAKQFGLVDSVVEKENKTQYIELLQLQLDNNIIDLYYTTIDSI